MADGDTQTNTEEFEPAVEGEIAESDFDHLAGIVTDGLIGAVGGLVGTAAMSIGLFVASSLGAFDMASFGILADLTGLDVLFPANAVAVGFLVFLGGGMLTWPLLFAATAAYLPGERFATKGLPYGFVLWTGFVLAFSQGIDGGILTLALYAVLTLVSHFAYGFSLGAVFDYLSDRPDTLV
ncbi:hypothetical protein SAMN05216388_10118 [Halorientalis persicus]|jgi:hypothetical protein|uniref:Uncharacterized protein n=1 Tax=Halorientalis persicus TaxID=1367881 RepID=A0A1H8NPW8_9EURY|nr:DUF6789 family protein [Halorientalis persicus]SEO31666.1 hypothetical protein SAMN05216388_10118 [Halorientalis persicus]